MVGVAPLPPGFGTPIAADTLPTEPPPVPTSAENLPPAAGFKPASNGPQRQPLEAWATPTGGYADRSTAALEQWERAEALRRQLTTTADGHPAIRHANDRASELAEREQAAEDRRQAGDPRKVLAAAHELRAEAVAEVARIAPLAERAGAVVADLEERHSEQAAAVEAGDQAAADRLIAALAEGTDNLPLNTRTDAVQSQVEATSARLGVARAARDRLEADLAAARDLLTQRTHGVARCALNVLIGEAAELATELIDIDAALARRRADLASLEQLISNESRRLNGVLPPLPRQVSRALYPADPQPTGRNRVPPATDWPARFAALQADDRLTGNGGAAVSSKPALPA
jgi:hypothetical protein